MSHRKRVAKQATDSDKVAEGFKVSAAASSAASNGRRDRRDASATFVQDGSGAFAFDKGQLARLLAQTLRELGYESSAHALEEESGQREEAPEVEQVIRLAADGAWDEAVAAHERVLSLAKDRDAEALLPDTVPQALRLEQFIELLEEGDTAGAVECLQTKLLALGTTDDVQEWSEMLLLSPKGLRKRLGRPRDRAATRATLSQELRKRMPHGALLPPRRLLDLLGQAVREQARHCLFNGAGAGEGRPHNYCPLDVDLQDAAARAPRLPARAVQTLTRGTEDKEVWNVAFSPVHGDLLVLSAGAWLLLYRVSYRKQNAPMAFLATQELSHCVNCLAWSPDGSRVLAGDAGGQVQLWEIGPERTPSDKYASWPAHTGCVSAVAWMDSEHFFSGGCRIILHDCAGNCLATWSGRFVHALCFVPDLGVLVASCGARKDEPHLRTIEVLGGGGARKKAARPESLGNGNGGGGGGDCEGSPNSADSIPRSFELREQTVPRGWCVAEGSVTSLTLSRRDKGLLTNVASSDIVEWDTDSGGRRCVYTGVEQGGALLRSAVGGFNNCLLACGGVDATISVWERHRADSAGTVEPAVVEPLWRLCGHTQTVNAVAWSPIDPSMLVSASDDGTVRVWHASGNTDDDPDDDSVGNDDDDKA